MNNFILIITSVILGSIGQIILKLGADKTNHIKVTGNKLLYFYHILYIPEIWLGIIFFGTSFLLWIKVLSKNQLSYAYPMVSLGYINVVIFSYFLFREPFTASKISGILMIILGVLLINR